MEFDYANFNQVSRIGEDSTSQTQDTLFNTGMCDYMTQNYFRSDSTMRHPIQFATSQPGVMFKGSNFISGDGSNIDKHSELTIGQIQTNPKCRIDLFTRPFATVPFLGRGNVDPDIETSLRMGTSHSSRKSLNPVPTPSYQVPLIPEMKQHMENTSKAIEYNALNGWTMGGMPTRDMTRDM